MIGRGYLIGAAVAVGGLMLIPGVAAAVGRAGRPLARAAMKTGATAYDEFRRAGAEAYEHLEDIAAEVRAEMAARAEQAGDMAAGAADAAESAAEATPEQAGGRG